MIINDDPSPIKRLRTETIKMIISSLYTIRSYTKQYVYFVLTGIVVVTAGIFYLADTVFSHEEKKLAPIESQRYNACVFGKDVINEKDGDLSIIDVDANCVQLSKSGKLVEPKEEDQFTAEIALMLEGHPMEVMAEHIAQQDKKVAGLIVGIARQESQWGKYAPSKAGVDCYNYWGYKTSGTRGQSMGYACFGSPEEAVETIAKRLDHFVYTTNRDTPAKMVTPWKCGNSCATHSPESVARWVGTVNTYYSQIISMDETKKNDNLTSKYLSRK
ncbi:MAG: hypothetical protein CR972_00995 [Candidatus Moraniibacteriota bacterium]|nr:MAG: hypothetical protein CR972_00995 [Candidatus Moranbacteria bacterium]